MRIQRNRFICLLLIFWYFAASAAAGEEKPLDRTGAWDLRAPLGPAETFRLSTREGTWMNLDVHPEGEYLVFDLLGDLYLLPLEGGEATPLTSGPATDIQPRFSPDGSQLLFTSDRGGQDAIWIADFADDRLTDFRSSMEAGGASWGSGSWDATGKWFLARKRVTDISSIGVSELWMFHLEGGSGVKLVGDGAEVASFSVSPDDNYIYFGASPPFRYDRNPHEPIWSVLRYDRRTGERRVISEGYGSSAAPRLSPDASQLAFVRRIGSKTSLWIQDLASGAERQVWDGLDRDQIEAFAFNNVYPGYAWHPDGGSIFIWAGGGIYEVQSGGGVAEVPFEVSQSLTAHLPLRSKRNPAEETITARMIRWPVFSPDGESLVFVAFGHLYWMQLPDGEPRRVTRQTGREFAPSFSADGRQLAFTRWRDEDGGALQLVNWQGGRPGRLSTRYESPTQLVNPAWSPDGTQIVLVAGSSASLRGLDLGSESRHDLLLLQARGDAEPAYVVSTANRGAQRRITRPGFSKDGSRIYYFDNEGGGGERGARQPPETALISVNLAGRDRQVHMKFRYAQEAIVSPDESLVAFTELHDAYVAAMPRAGETVSLNPGAASVPFQRLTLSGGEWVNWSGDWLSFGFGSRVSRLPVDELELGASLDPREAGDDGVLILPVQISAAGDYLYEGASYALADLKPLLESAWLEAAKVRVDVELMDATPWSAWKLLKTWLEEVKVGVRLASESPQADAGEDVQEVAEETAEESRRSDYEIDLTLPRAKPEGRVAYVGARLITMQGRNTVEDGTLITEGNRILAVGPSAEVNIPRRTRTFDVSGKTIIPGFVDVHAHMGYGVLDINPEKEWRYYANLAYGVTTTHDPSASTHAVFSQSEMVEAGVMVGPRIFSTGFILYGALHTDMAEISSHADALAHVRRLKKLGAFSVKSYMQPRRDQRQWVIQAARAEDMLVFPEGGGNFPANMGMILDGHSGIEHSLSVGNIYQDVVQLFASTRVGYSPTLLVAYGGQAGENWFYQHYDVWRDEKLQSFFPRGQIDARSRRRTMSAEDDFNHKSVSRGLKQVAEAGGLVLLGAHGQLQGLGTHWELWALVQGGMSEHDALLAATINGAEYLGMDAHLGSLEAGKLADFVVLDANPLDDIENSSQVRMTVINGVVYDAYYMDQLWPEQVTRGRFHFQAEK